MSVFLSDVLQYLMVLEFHLTIIIICCIAIRSERKPLCEQLYQGFSRSNTLFIHSNRNTFWQKQNTKYLNMGGWKIVITIFSKYVDVYSIWVLIYLSRRMKLNSQLVTQLTYIFYSCSATILVKFGRLPLHYKKNLQNGSALFIKILNLLSSTLINLIFQVPTGQIH